MQWPKPVFKSKRAITTEEHAVIVARELNAERRDFYELLWYTGAAQSDALYRCVTIWGRVLSKIERSSFCCLFGM